MKNLKLLLQCFVFFPFLFPWSVNAQDNLGFRNPVIWLRADKPGQNVNQWQDVSGHGYDGVVLNNQTLPDTCLFNYNRSFLFDSSSIALKINYKAKKNAKMLVFAVYKPLTQQQEKGIWSLGLDSNIQVKLTTQRLKNVYKFIKYNDSTSVVPTINLLSQNWRNKHIDTTFSSLIVGGTDSLSYTGKFAEFILYDTTLTGNDIYKVHTYLGIKYGVSICDMNYVNSKDSTLWGYKGNLQYKNDIAGIGKDSLLQINQKQSAGNGGESPLKIAAGRLQINNDTNKSQIAEGDFLIWGHNDEFLSDINADSTAPNQITFMTKCTWLMKASGQSSNQIPTQVVLNTADLYNVSDVRLVINRYGTKNFTTDSCYMAAPDSVDSTGNFYFNNILWDIDGSGSDIFSFKIRKSGPQNRSLEDSIANANSSAGQNNNGAGNSGSAILDYSMFPNPTTKDYTIYVKISDENPITVCITDGNGKVINCTDRSGSLNYTLTGYLYEKGCYLVTVTTTTESKSYKLIVQ